MSKKAQIHFISGKGGIGKSTVSFALAKHFARCHKKTLLIELGSESFFQKVLGLESIGLTPQAVYSSECNGDHLFVARLEGKDCLKQYVTYLFKSQLIHQLVFNNKISKVLIDVAPGLFELAILGKITSGQRKVGPSFDFDVIVVDGYSTGHSLSLFRVPFGMHRAVQVGPMGKHTKGIIDCLQNKNLSKFWCVTQLEELPFTEANEYKKNLQTELGIEVNLIINKLFEPAFSVEELTSKKRDLNNAGEQLFLETIRIKREQQEHYLSQIHGEKNIKLKLHLNKRGLDLIEALSKEFNEFSAAFL